MSGFKRRVPINLTLIITAYNEGLRLHNTIDSVFARASPEVKVIVVDDGSDVVVANQVESRRSLQIIRHEQRIGIGASRLEASRLVTQGVIGYLDGHQLIEGDSLQQCAEAAEMGEAIVCPDTADFDSLELLHGAYFTQTSERKLLGAEWKRILPSARTTKVSSLKAPAYFVPSHLFSRLRWSSLLRGWGGSEASVSLKAFFTGIPILHLCGPLIRHQFKKQFHYDVGWPEVWRNQAIVTRICFDDSTWHRYWLPEVFAPHLTAEAKRVLESDEIKLERAEFAKFKVRSDREFWTRLIFQKLPAVLE